MSRRKHLLGRLQYVFVMDLLYVVDCQAVLASNINFFVELLSIREVREQRIGSSTDKSLFGISGLIYLACVRHRQSEHSRGSEPV